MSNSNDQIKPQLFHEFLSDKINQSNVSQIDIAQELGFDQPNIISMFKSGKTKLPLRVIPKLAAILKVDPKQMLRLGMLEYQPETLRAVESVFGGAITKNEQMILDEIRRLSQGTDPAMTSIISKEMLAIFVDKMMNN